MMSAAVATEPRTWSDAHLHLWDSSQLALPWLVNAPRLAGCFDFARYMGEGGVGGTVVLVEADVAPNESAREARWLAHAATEQRRTAAIVAGVDPSAASLQSDLEECTREPAVRGARRVLHGSEFLCVSERFESGLRALASRRMTFDFCVRWQDLPQVEECARRNSQAIFVLDHLGNPPMRAGVLAPEREQWRRLIARVAACENVCVKWSGMFENAGRRVSVDEARPWFEWCIECFGPARVLWGSNWPVCFTAARLEEWIEVSAVLAGELSAGEQNAVLGANAQRVYRM